MNEARAIICCSSHFLCCVLQGSWQNVVRVENMLTCRDEFEKVENSEKVQNKKSNKKLQFWHFSIFCSNIHCKLFQVVQIAISSKMTLPDVVKEIVEATIYWFYTKSASIIKTLSIPTTFSLINTYKSSLHLYWRKRISHYLFCLLLFYTAVAFCSQKKQRMKLIQVQVTTNLFQIWDVTITNQQMRYKFDWQKHKLK